MDLLANIDSGKHDIPSSILASFVFMLLLLRLTTASVYQYFKVYVVADLSQPDASIIRNSPSWDDEPNIR
jgi:hypothetical protein